MFEGLKITDDYEIYINCLLTKQFIKRIVKDVEGMEAGVYLYLEDKLGSYKRFDTEKEFDNFINKLNNVSKAILKEIKK